MVKRQKAEGTLSPLVGEVWPGRLEIADPQEPRRDQGEQQRFFVLTEVLRLATWVILILLGYGLAKPETLALTKFEDRAWWIVFGLLVGALGRARGMKFLDWCTQIGKRK